MSLKSFRPLLPVPEGFASCLTSPSPEGFASLLMSPSPVLSPSQMLLGSVSCFEDREVGLWCRSMGKGGSLTEVPLRASCICHGVKK